MSFFTYFCGLEVIGFFFGRLELSCSVERLIAVLWTCFLFLHYSLHDSVNIIQ